MTKCITRMAAPAARWASASSVPCANHFARLQAVHRAAIRALAFAVWATSRYTLGWLFHSFMSALGLGQNTPLGRSGPGQNFYNCLGHDQTLASQWAYWDCGR